MVAIYFILTIIPSSLFLTLFGSENIPQNVKVELSNFSDSGFDETAVQWWSKRQPAPSDDWIGYFLLPYIITRELAKLSTRLKAHQL